MSKVTAIQSMSLDGFTAGANVSVDNPMGDGGLRLHEWIFGLDSWRERQGLEGGERNADAELVEETFARIGSVVMGRTMFDAGEEPWGDDPPFRTQVYVLTHEKREPLVKQGGTTFTFVNDGVERALELARVAAGDKDVSVGGGANTVQQFIAAGLLDEIVIDLVPIFLGDGVRLFDGVSSDTRFERIDVIDSPTVTHIRYRVVK